MVSSVFALPGTAMAARANAATAAFNSPFIYDLPGLNDWLPTPSCRNEPVACATSSAGHPDLLCVLNVAGGSGQRIPILRGGGGVGNAFARFVIEQMDVLQSP